MWAAAPEAPWPRPRGPRSPDGGPWPKADRAPQKTAPRGAVKKREAERIATKAPVDELLEFGCDANGCAVSDLDEPLQHGGTGLLEDPSSEFVSADPAEIRRFSAKPTAFLYEVLEVTVDGMARNRTISRGEILASSVLRPRDLRAVTVPGTPDDAGALLASRRGVLMLALGGVRAIVDSRRGLVFGPGTREVSRFLRVFAHQRRSAPDSGLQLLLVESALLAHSRQLEARLLAIRAAIEPKLQAPPVLREPDLEEARQFRRRLARYGGQASVVSQALLSRLDSEEAPLAAEGEDRLEAIEEWEAMLEVYLQAYSELARECTSLLQDIEDFEGSASLALQARRLYLEQFELSLVIASLSATAANLLPGTMGMNLPNGLENSDRAFSGAVLVTFVIGGSLFASLRWLAAKQGFLS